MIRMTRDRTAAAMIAVMGPVLAVPAFFAEDVPFWLAGLPLLAGIWAGTPLARAAAMAGWAAVPAAVSAVRFAGIGHAPAIVWPGAAMAVLGLAVLAALAGISPVTVAVTLVPFFPASPLLALADALPGLGIPGLGAAALCLAAIEPVPRFRVPLLLVLVGLLAAWKMQEPPPVPSVWTELPSPPGVTDQGRRAAIRGLLPEGGSAILGEAVFRSEDLSARAAWCRAVEARDLTLFVGVTETRAGTDRGAVWRLDRDICAPGRAPAVAARSWLGIPGVTGGWLPMSADGTDGGGPDFLVCLEAFLPWSWARLAFAGGTGTVAVVSNDGAFGALPVPVLRRKAAGAMAALIGRDAVHAETGRTVLVRAQGAR